RTAAPVRVEPEAPPLRRSVVVGGALTALVALIAYIVTLDPSLPTGDSGELITAARVWGVAHPPGDPLYTMLGHVSMWLPFGSPALRMNLLSAVLDAAAVGVVFVLVYRLVEVTARDRSPGGQAWTPFAAAAVGSLLLAFSTVFWSYSVVAEVFALNNLFAALLLLLAFEWSRRPDHPKLLWVFALLLGLALTNQQTLSCLVPAVLVLAWAGLARLRRTGPLSRGLRLRDIAAAVAFFVAGLLPYLYLPIAARRNPAVDWGDPQTVDRFVQHVSRANYGTFRLSVEGRQGSVSEQLGLLTSNLLRGFVVAGVVLALLGGWWTWRNRRAAGLALVTAFLFAGPVFVAYSKVYVPDDLTKGVIARFYMLPSIPLALLAGAGAWVVLVWAGRIRRPTTRPGLAPILVALVLLAITVGAAGANGGTANHSGDRVALHYAEDLLRPLAPNSLLLMRSDENFTSVDYAQLVAGYRKDVIAIDTELLKLSTYV